MSSLSFVFASPAHADFNLCNAQTKYLAATSWSTENRTIILDVILSERGFEDETR
jgi:uncharacterized membrane protein